ncbi:MAG: Ferric uptake regulator, Fur family [Candidatus Gottesmanbacteria bacterium GW2011_GWC2_39_8]|uniref:Ferric uptake regulator, Fur family n=1 Tax=Candidatus Gottesmanbacteria bacterium GW2011_GWC2_39_8 TaxID=1618450 RepID=A0A0G0PZR6_9BACT|nr:MAG: Ferric uptake regulator, Fur family [Candidatus Gottesmanbacteria bacterium GW2011_GWC2_39_8]
MKNTSKHDCKTELRNADLKVTPARLGILGALENTSKPLDIVSLIKYLNISKIKADRVTVFRIINALVIKGLVKPIQFNDGKLRYEHMSKADHHHFICGECGDIEDILECNVEKIEKNIQKKKGVLVKYHSLEFFGLCSRCKK